MIKLLEHFNDSPKIHFITSCYYICIVCIHHYFILYVVDWNTLNMFLISYDSCHNVSTQYKQIWCKRASLSHSPRYRECASDKPVVYLWTFYVTVKYLDPCCNIWSKIVFIKGSRYEDPYQIIKGLLKVNINQYSRDIFFIKDFHRSQQSIYVFTYISAF